jgi:hypothetical protein
VSLLDALGIRPGAPAPGSSAQSFVAAVAGDPAALEALLTEKLLDAIVTQSPQRGVTLVQTPLGSLTLTASQALPETTLLLLRPAAQPGRAIVTVRGTRGAAPSGSGAAGRAAAMGAVSVDVKPIVQGRILAAAAGAPGPALPPGAIVELRIEGIEPPTETPGPTPATGRQTEPAIRGAPAPPAPPITDAPVPTPPANVTTRSEPPRENPARADMPARPTVPSASVPALEARPPAPDETNGGPLVETAAPTSPGEIPRRGDPGRHAGIILASHPGETIAETDIGRVAIPAELGAPRGTTIVFTVLREMASRPAATPRPNGTPPVQRELAAAVENALGAAARQAVAPFVSALQPAPERILAAILSFAAAARGEAADPLTSLVEKLQTEGDAPAPLQEAAGELRAAAERTHPGPLQPVFVPMMDGSSVQPLTVFLPRDREALAREGDESARFAVDVELTRFGALQLDGLVGQRRLDLILRSRHSLPLELRQELALAFRDSVEASGFKGEMSFAVSSSFPVGLPRQRAISIRA